MLSAHNPLFLRQSLPRRPTPVTLPLNTTLNSDFRLHGRDTTTVNMTATPSDERVPDFEPLLLGSLTTYNHVSGLETALHATLEGNATVEQTRLFRKEIREFSALYNDSTFKNPSTYRPRVSCRECPNTCSSAPSQLEKIAKRLVPRVLEHRLKRVQYLVNDERIFTAKGKKLMCKAMEDRDLQNEYWNIVPSQWGGNFPGLRGGLGKKRKELLVDLLLKVSEMYGEDPEIEKLASDKESEEHSGEEGAEEDEDQSGDEGESSAWSG